MARRKKGRKIETEIMGDRKSVAFFRDKKSREIVLSKRALVKPRVRITVPRTKYWWVKRRVITLSWIVVSMYAEDYANNDFSNIFIRKVSIRVNTSLSSLPRIIHRLEPLVEQEVRLQEPTAVVLGAVLIEVKVGKRTDEKFFVPSEKPRTRVGMRKRLKEVT